MGNVGWDPQYFSGTQFRRLAVDLEAKASRQQDRYLLVRVLMPWHLHAALRNESDNRRLWSVDYFASLQGAHVLFANLLPIEEFHAWCFLIKDAAFVAQ
jgi:hypothetical protein